MRVIVNGARIIRIPADLCARAGFRPRQRLAFGWTKDAGVAFPEEREHRYPYPEPFYYMAASDGSLGLDMDVPFQLRPGDVVAVEGHPGEITITPLVNAVEAPNP